jgi:hypothetical protein
MEEKNFNFRKYKKDDVYHYLVDNLPLEDLLSCCVSLQLQIQGRPSPSEFSTITAVENTKVTRSLYDSAKISDFSEVTTSNALQGDVLVSDAAGAWKPTPFTEAPLSSFKHTVDDLDPANSQDAVLLGHSVPDTNNTNNGDPIEYLAKGSLGDSVHYTLNGTPEMGSWGPGETPPWMRASRDINGEPDNQQFFAIGLRNDISSAYNYENYHAKWVCSHSSASSLEELDGIINAWAYMTDVPNSQYDMLVTESEALSIMPSVGAGPITYDDWVALLEWQPKATATSEVLTGTNKYGEYIFSDGFMIKWQSGIGYSPNNTNTATMYWRGTEFDEVYMCIGSLVHYSGSECDQHVLIHSWTKDYCKYYQSEVVNWTNSSGSAYAIVYALGKMKGR